MKKDETMRKWYQSPVKSFVCLHHGKVHICGAFFMDFLGFLVFYKPAEYLSWGWESITCAHLTCAMKDPPEK